MTEYCKDLVTCMEENNSILEAEVLYALGFALSHTYRNQRGLQVLSNGIDLVKKLGKYAPS